MPLLGYYFIVLWLYYHSDVDNNLFGAFLRCFEIFFTVSNTLFDSFALPIFSTPSVFLHTGLLKDRFAPIYGLNLQLYDAFTEAVTPHDYF